MEFVMIIYGSSLSFFVRKVLAYAAERGIEVESRVVNPRAPDPDFVEASPLRKIPAMRDGDYCLADSSAIIHYLEAKYPEGALIPAEPEARGRTIWFEEFADTVLSACCGKIFFNRIVAPRFMGLEGDAAAADLAEHTELPPILAYLESIVPEQAFLVGTELTLADLAVASPFVNFIHMGIAIDANRYPRLTSYIGRMLARPSFAPFVEGESRFLRSMT
jgi:glutathione S-transferase